MRRLAEAGLCLPAEGFKAGADLSYFPTRCGLRLNCGQAASDCGEFWSSGMDEAMGSVLSRP